MQDNWILEVLGPKYIVSMHSSVFDPFFTKHKPTGWSKASEGPKGPIYGQMRAFWGHRGPQLRAILVSNCCSMGHLPCIQMCLIHFSLKTSQLVGPRLGRAPNAVLEPSEGLLG